MSGIFAVITDEDGQTLMTAMTFLFVIVIFGFCLWWAINQLNELKRETRPADPTSIITADIDGPVIRLQSKIELPEYRRLIYIITFTSPAMLFICFIGITIILLSLLQGESNWFPLFFTFFLLFIPISVYRSSRANYKSTKALHEPISYEITPTTISTAGTTFTSTVTWDSLYNTRELKHWFLLYTNKQIAMIVPKRAFASEEEMSLFRGWCGRGK